MQMKSELKSVAMASAMAVLSVGATPMHLGEDVFVGDLYSGEMTTIPRSVASKLGRGVMRSSALMTNSVSSFLGKCDAKEIESLTNGMFLVSAFYNHFEVNGYFGWALSMCLFPGNSASRRLVQFSILPNGTIIRSRLPRPGEVYVIKNAAIEIDESRFAGLIPPVPGMRKIPSSGMNEAGR